MAVFRFNSLPTSGPAAALRLTELEDRTVPIATLLSPDFASATAGANAPVAILGASDNGQQVLFQTTATNIVEGQIDVPDTMDLFLLNRAEQGRVSLISAFDFGPNAANNGQKAIGVTASIPGELNNAVISSSGSAIAFLSSAPSLQFNQLTYTVNTDGGGEDLFVYNVAAAAIDRAGRTDAKDGDATRVVTLASIDKLQRAIGSNKNVANPAISANGNTVAFVTDANPNRVVEVPGTRGPYDTDYDTVNKRPTDFKIHTGNTLFRSTTIGELPEPVTFLFYSADLIPDTSATTQPYYKFYDDVQVDPLGRYMDAAGVSYAATVIDRFNPTPFSTRGAARDAYRFSFAADNVGGISAPRAISFTSNPIDFTSSGSFFGLGGDEGQADDFLGFGDNTSTYQLGLRGLGNVENAYITRDRGDIIMTASSTPGVPFIDNFFGFFGPGFDPTLFPGFVPPTPPPAVSGAVVPDYVNQNGNTAEVYRVRITGVATGTILLSRDSSQPGNVGANGVLDNRPGALAASPDARRVTFVSKATNLATDVTDTNEDFDVFQLDIDRNTISAVSVTAANSFRTGNGPSTFPSATSDGLVVAYESQATNLVSVPDANGLSDVFVRDLVRQTTNVVSSPPGNPGTANGTSSRPIVTGTFRGGRVFFSSDATDLDPNSNLADPNGKLANPAQIYDQNVPIIINASSRFVAFAGGSGGFATVGRTTPDGDLAAGKQFQPFVGFRGELRVASGDFNGDGIQDLIVGAGVGGGPRVQVIDGRTGRTLDDFFAFESSFTGGVYVSSGDFNNDGRDDIVVGAGETGGPRVQVYDARTRRLLVDQFAFEPQSRVGVRVASGDFSGDGRADLLVAAGQGGGPRVKVFDGRNVAGLNTIADFFAFDPNDRSGINVSAGDFNNDGRADIAVGTGPGSETTVRIYNAANLLVRDPNAPVILREFQPYGPGDTTGARVALRNIESEENADILVASASGVPSIRTFAGNALGGSSTAPIQIQDISPFGDLSGEFGAFVG